MESLAADLRTLVRTPLQQDHVARLREVGEVRSYAAGDWLVRLGEPVETFFYVEDGEIEAVEPITGRRYGTATLGPAQFYGEISLLSGGRTMLPARAVVDSRVLAVPREAVLGLMRTVPEMSDIIVTVLAGRRRRLLESNESALTLVGAEENRDLRRIAAFAGRNRIPVRMLPIDGPEAAQVAAACGIAPGRPAAIFGTDRVIAAPTPEKVAQLLGLDLDMAEGETFDVLIVGAGPAGIAAAVYAGAEGLSALVLDDLAIGGQAGQSSRIENYMGFPTGISGADLCWRGEIQAMKFGTRFAVPRRAAGLARQEDGTFRATLDDGRAVCARAVVVATGVQYRRLELDRLEEFEGSGIYYAATETEARYCRETEVVVIGGGNSAGQAAMFLSRTARHVHLLVRGPSLAASMSDYLLSRLEADPRISIHTRCELTALEGTDRLEAVTIRHHLGGPDRRIDTRALFVMVGAAPNTDWLSGCVALDPRGFVLTGEAAGAHGPYATSMPGIFAVGDVRAGSVKRVASAVGEGSVVISQVWAHVNAD